MRTRGHRGPAFRRPHQGLYGLSRKLVPGGGDRGAASCGATTWFDFVRCVLSRTAGPEINCGYRGEIRSYSEDELAREQLSQGRRPAGGLCDHRPSPRAGSPTQGVPATQSGDFPRIVRRSPRPRQLSILGRPDGPRQLHLHVPERPGGPRCWALFGPPKTMLARRAIAVRLGRARMGAGRTRIGLCAWPRFHIHGSVVRGSTGGGGGDKASPTTGLPACLADAGGFEKEE